MSAEITLLLSLSALVLSEDVTTIFQLKKSDDGKWITAPHFAHQITDGQILRGHDYLGSLRVLTRNNARGFPVRKGKIALLDKWAGQPCCESWSHVGWGELTGEEALEQETPLELDILILNDKQSIPASVWRLNQETAELRSPPIPQWFVSGDICVSIAARVGTRATLVVSLEQYHDQDKKSRELVTITGPTRPTWLQKRIVINPDRTVLDGKVPVQIVLTGKLANDTNSTVLVQWAAGCNPDSRGDDVAIDKLVPASDWKNQLGFRTNQRQHNPAEFLELSFKPKSHSVCQNDGLLFLEAGCLCRPGFTGRLCEKGCGPNRFGDNCESRCSEDFDPRECRGMMLCTPDLTCDCGPGFKGPQCDQPCEKGKYGIGCRQSCGICSFGETCDPYTGWCTRGCRGALLPPLCRKECGRKSVVAHLIGFGSVADAPQYPWHVGVFDNHFIPRGSNQTTIELICGGTLISPQTVLTVGHCVYNELEHKLLPAEQFSVGLGKQKRGWNAEEKFPERIQRTSVLSVHIREYFGGVVSSKEDDIALLVLATPVQETEYVIPACFDMVGGFKKALSPGTVGYVVGWGSTQNNTPSEDLREASFPVISRRECIDSAPENFRPYISKDRFCAGKKGAYVNRGDSGNGFVVPQNGAWFLSGFVSVAYPDEKGFACYTNVSYHRDWIVNSIQVAALRNAIVDAFFL